ncbi:hypothetical protein [Malikia sp.]|uniref:hypothetical protein n=1 Tax=Malikia sp. TaxID=2070706 RepID=UPI002631D178|nr:hypothetical protein [Malikia sp.]MDD2728297.1 hypothetical protein [Malikia sp.]
MSPKKCSTCNRDPKRMNSDFAECSHIDCPARRKAWSEQPSHAEFFKGPWPKSESSDPVPLDQLLKGDAS